MVAVAQSSLRGNVSKRCTARALRVFGVVGWRLLELGVWACFFVCMRAYDGYVQAQGAVCDRC